MKNETKNKGVKNSSIENSSLLNLADFLSGETSIKEREARLKELKEKNLERREASKKQDLRDGIVQKNIQLEEKENIQKVVQNIKLFSWTAPIRVKFDFDSNTFLYLVAFTLLFILYLAFLGHYVLMVVLVAIVFFIYAAGVTEPISVEHSITARGVDTLDKLYEWYLLEDFRFTVKNGKTLLIIETQLRFPAKLILIIDPKDVKAIYILLQDKLLYKDIRKQSLIDKLTFGEYIPLEKV